MFHTLPKTAALTEKRGLMLYYFIIKASDYIISGTDYIITSTDFIITGTDYKINDGVIKNKGLTKTLSVQLLRKYCQDYRTFVSTNETNKTTYI